MESDRYNMNNKDENGKVIIDDTIYETRLNNKFKLRKKYEPTDPNKILAIIPGIIKNIFVGEGDSVKYGTPLLVLEAMKMENAVVCQTPGKIKSINVSVGQMVTKGYLLIELE